MSCIIRGWTQLRMQLMKEIGKAQPDQKRLIDIVCAMAELKAVHLRHKNEEVLK